MASPGNQHCCGNCSGTTVVPYCNESCLIVVEIRMTDENPHDAVNQLILVRQTNLFQHACSCTTQHIHKSVKPPTHRVPSVL